MKKYSLLLVLISLLPLIGFLPQGLPLTHDGQDQVARIANFYQALREGNIVPRWAGNLNWGYGHPVLMFLYPLPSYLASVFHFLGFSFIDSTKMVFGLSFVFSGVFMFFWIGESWGVAAGWAAALLYLFAPYRFVDLYVRGAIGECLAFVWPPLIAWSIQRLFRERREVFLIIGSLALAALILSHNALSLMFLPVILVYMGFLISLSQRKGKLVRSYLKLLFWGFALSAFFWLPALFEGKYTLRNIVTKDNITGFEPLKRLVWSEWNYGGTGTMSAQIGVLQWLVVIVGPIFIWRLWRRGEIAWRWLAFCWLAFVMVIFLILPEARPIYLLFTLLQKFQFAWRFLSLAIFLAAILGGGVIGLWKDHASKLLTVVIVVAVSLLLTWRYWQPNGYVFHDDSFFSGWYPGTTDTGESAPRWSVRFMEVNRPARLGVIEGEVKIREGEQETNRHEYRVVVTEKARLVDYTLYFPGWQVLVDGGPTEVEFQDQNYRGLMTFWVPAGEHELVIEFTDTRLRRTANLVSILGGVILLVVGIIKRRR